MRKVATLVSALILGIASASIQPSGAAAGPVLTQRQSGRADGEASFALDTKVQTDAGDYVTNGQLGRGRYAFRLTYDDTSCSTAHRTMSASGTARLARSDGAVLSGTVTATEDCLGTRPLEHVVFQVTLTQGSRELVGARATWDGTIVLRIAPDSELGPSSYHVAGTSEVTRIIGYWLLGTTGHVTGFGGARALGSMDRQPVVAITPVPNHDGYWVLDATGRVHAFGAAHRYGDADGPALAAHGEVLVSLIATAGGDG